MIEFLLSNVAGPAEIAYRLSLALLTWCGGVVFWEIVQESRKRSSPSLPPVSSERYHRGLWITYVLLAVASLYMVFLGG